jgi:hypothetical protein
MEKVLDIEFYQDGYDIKHSNCVEIVLTVAPDCYMGYR